MSEKNQGFPELKVFGITCPKGGLRIFNEHDDLPDRMTVSLEHGPDIVIIRTDVGWVVDAYHPATGEMISTLNVWDDQIEDEDDEV